MTIIQTKDDIKISSLNELTLTNFQKKPTQQSRLFYFHYFQFRRSIRKFLNPDTEYQDNLPGLCFLTLQSLLFC